MPESDWKATHVSKTSGIYVRSLFTESGTVAFDTREGVRRRWMQSEFDATFRDLNDIKGYADGLDQEDSSQDPRESSGEDGSGQAGQEGQEVGSAAEAAQEPGRLPSAEDLAERAKRKKLRTYNGPGCPWFV